METTDLTNTARLATILFAGICVSLSLVGCLEGPADGAGETADALVELTFAPTNIRLVPLPTDQRIALDGTIDGQPATVFIDLSKSALEQLPPGAAVTLSGETWFANASSASFMAHEEQSPVVVRAWVWGSCETCAVVESWQAMYGTLRLDETGPDHLSGVFDLVLEGDVPATQGIRGVQLAIRGPFAVDTAPVEVPVEPDPTATEPSGPGETTEPPINAGTPPTPGTSPTIIPAGPPASVNSAIFEVTLTAEWGIDFATGLLVKKANWSNCDLFATAGHKFLKLSPGGASPTTGQPLRWFQNIGGFVQTFGSIEDVPLQLPTEEDGSKSLVKAKPYVGFVVKANLSNHFARVWIRDAGPDFVTIEYQLMSPAE